MRDLPHGTVTFLFTDVEGSTRLLHELGVEAYAEALAEHRRLIRRACAAHEGAEVDTQGDAFFFAFATAPGALAAARAANEALATGPIRVRMGLHTGTPLLAEEGYVGADVHRAARIAAAGHGGQVLVSAASAALLDRHALRDLGEHRFKDLAAPERVYQLGETEFPALASLYRTNLPIAATPFLGRERELAEVVALLVQDEVRLLTLTGSGGTGKTRLALQAAAEAGERFPDGVWWVPLAPIQDPALVPAQAAQALGAAGELADHVADRRLLLLLDNFEHLLDAAPGVASFLGACPNARVLATSRELLQLQGEHAYAVPTLSHDDGTGLFLARARAIAPDLAVDDAVGELCTRLDNLPLALELAAARTRHLTPAQLLERLAQRLDLLRGGRDSDPRQETLRATISWSHDLLDEGEQQLFARLSVFAGRCTLETAEDVCDADLEPLSSLVDKSLVRRTGDAYWMLETIRAFATERLRESGEVDELHARHAHAFFALADSLGLRPEELESVRVESYEVALTEQDNLRAALDWCLEADPELGLRLTSALEQHWVSHNPFEGKRRFEALLARAGEIPLELRARSIRGLGGTSELSGELEAAERCYEQSLALYEQLGNEWGIVHLRHRLGNCAVQRGDWASAEALFAENLVRARAGGFRFLEAEALGGLGWAAGEAGRLEVAHELTRQYVEFCREVPWMWGEALGLVYLAELSLELGRIAETEEHAAAALELARQMDDRLDIVRSVALLAAAARAGGDLERSGLLWGAIEAEEAHGPVGRGAPHRKLAERILADGGTELERALEAGRQLSLDEALSSS